MRENRLTPVAESSHDPLRKLPVERAKAQLERYTRYWPMIISQTTIFNMQAVRTDALSALLPLECSQEISVWTFCLRRWFLWLIWSWRRLSRKRTSSPARKPSTTWWTWRGRTTPSPFLQWDLGAKAPRGDQIWGVFLQSWSRVSRLVFSPLRDEQYRIMWNELETLVKTHAGATDRHQRVLDCIVACRSKPPEEEERKKRGRKREDREDRAEKNGSKEPEDKSWQDSERSVRLIDQS